MAKDALTSDATDVLATTAAGPRAIRGSALRVAGYGAGVVLSVVAAALMTRHLGPVDYGRYVVVQSVVMIVAGLAEAGMVNIGVREFAARAPADRDAMVANLQGIRLAFAAVGLAVAVLFGVVAGYSGAMIAGLALTGLGVVLQTVQQTWGIPLQATLRLGWITGLEVTRQAAQVAGIIALVAAGSGLLGFFVIPVPVGVLLCLLTLPLARGLAPLGVRFDRAQWRALLRMVAPYAAATMVGSVYVYLAAVLMSLVASPHDVGIFSASFRVFIVVSGIALLVVGSAFPILARAAHNDASRMAYATRRLFEASVVAGTWLGLMTFLCAPLAIDVIAGSSFHESIGVLRVQGAAVAFGFVGVMGSYALVSLHRHRVLLVGSGAGLLVSGALTLSLAPSIGPYAGAIANVGGEATIALIYVAALVRPPSRLPLGAGVVVRTAVAAAAAAALGLVPGLPDVALAVLATGVFFGVALVLHAIPRELLEAIPRPR